MSIPPSFDDPYFIFNTVWTLVMGCLGATLFIYVVNYIESNRFAKLLYSNENKRWIIGHIFFGGVVACLLFFEHHYGNVISRSLVSFIEGLSWPAIFAISYEGFSLFRTKAEASAVKELIDETK